MERVARTEKSRPPGEVTKHCPTRRRMWEKVSPNGNLMMEVTTHKDKGNTDADGAKICRGTSFER